MVTFWVITNVIIITFFVEPFTQTRRSMTHLTYTVLVIKYRQYNPKNKRSYLYYFGIHPLNKYITPKQNSFS